MSEMFDASEQARFGEFEADLKARGRKARTVEAYRSDWRGLATWWAGHYKAPFTVSEITEAAAAEYKAALVGEGMTPSTVNRKLVFLKAYARWARAQGYLTGGAEAAVRELSAVAQDPRKPKGLSDREEAMLLEVVEECGSTRDRAIIWTLLETGLRVGELVEITREQLELGSRRAWFHIPGPAGAPVRRVPIGRTARRALKTYLIEPRGDGPGPLFLGERGPLTANGIQRMLRGYGRKAGITVTPHILRHTFAMRALEEGKVDINTLAELLGHGSLETTRLYLEQAAARGRAAETPARMAALRAAARG
ncbi:MAG: tyrosine-type recombinase/integrase [Bradymonadia bacterium]